VDVIAFTLAFQQNTFVLYQHIGGDKKGSVQPFLLLDTQWR
jgi:hypothetical protein